MSDQEQKPQAAPDTGGATPPDDPNSPTHFAYTVRQDRNGQNHWTRLGAGWPDVDGGFSIQLDAAPVDGRISLRPREALERMRAERQRQPSVSPQQDPTIKP